MGKTMKATPNGGGSNSGSGKQYPPAQSKLGMDKARKYGTGLQKVTGKFGTPVEDNLGPNGKGNKEVFVSGTKLKNWKGPKNGSVSTKKGAK
jgi:hypothetical protein